MVSIVCPSIFYEVMELGAMILVFECWVLSQLFHSLLSLSSRGSSVPLHFLRVVSSEYLRLLIFLLGNLDFSLCFIQLGSTHDVLIS